MNNKDYDNYFKKSIVSVFELIRITNLVGVIEVNNKIINKDDAFTYFTKLKSQLISVKKRKNYELNSSF